MELLAGVTDNHITIWHEQSTLRYVTNVRKRSSSSIWIRRVEKSKGVWKKEVWASLRFSERAKYTISCVKIILKKKTTVKEDTCKRFVGVFQCLRKTVLNITEKKYIHSLHWILQEKGLYAFTMLLQLKRKPHFKFQGNIGYIKYSY